MNMKFFSSEGAHLLIPQLEESLTVLKVLKAQILQKQIQIDSSLTVSDVSESSTRAASQQVIQKEVKELGSLILEFKEQMKKIEDWGCQLKDIDLGLVDFFYIRNDEIVNLCWKSGESKIQYWHELEKGYTQRKKL
ncbi:MAG: DUF2203 domain-containing protein [Chlamydiae bacterium]|nr:DUF2203 domain-containing protein [Chlamydiota bacterium]MBI3265859.1 DUF2203 domain-containing protein [Chlamydiota bacterium]